MKRIILLSGGHSSALVALNIAAKHGTEDIILLNHNINNKKEDPDIKRFKREIASFLNLQITYANFDGILDDSEIPNQFEVCTDAGALTNWNGQAICTHYLKTAPFFNYLEEFHPDKDCIIYYGFDKKEKDRVQRRSSIMAAKGYKTAYPLFYGEKLIYKTTLDVGIKPPLTYSTFEHANCIGCLKAGLLHWYVVYCNHIDIYREAIQMEDEIGFVIHTIKEKGIKIQMSLRELMPLYCQIKALGVKPTEHQNKIKFGRALKRLGLSEDKIFKPCDCHV